MATRSIVTSQPDVACDVCMRRLLRGERPDVFLADGGRRMTVCELCAPRAAHEGWLRERDAPAVIVSAARPRRGRGLLGRLRGRVEPNGLLSGPSAQTDHAEGFESVELAQIADLSSVKSVPGGAVPAEPLPAEPLPAEPVPAEPVPAEPVPAKPVPAEPVAAGPLPAGPAEEGSWRDAWMFVTE